MRKQISKTISALVCVLLSAPLGALAATPYTDATEPASTALAASSPSSARVLPATDVTNKAVHDAANDTGARAPDVASNSDMPINATSGTLSHAAAPSASDVAPGVHDSSSATAAASAATAASAAIAPIEANGLIAQLLRQVAHWVDGLSDQVSKLESAVLAFPAFLTWCRHTFGTPNGQALLLKAFTALGAVFIIGLALEWLLRYALRRPRGALIAHADSVERRARNRAAREAQTRREQAEAAAKADLATQTELKRQQETGVPSNAVDADGATGATGAVGTADAKASSGAPNTKPAGPNAADLQAEPAGDVALMRTQVDGTERVEAVKVDAGDGASGAAANEVLAAAAASAEPVEEKTSAVPAQHWSTLRHMPYAIAALALDVLPLVLFFFAAGLVLRCLAGDRGSVQDMTSGFIDAYLTTRVTMAVIRLLVSPVGHGLRVLRVTPEMSRIVEHWVRRIIVVAAFGVAIANGAGAFGAGLQGRVAFMKLVSLIVHISVVILIFRCRRSVGTLIAAAPQREGAVAGVRNWLADVWAFFAAFVVMAVWVVWALGVEDGFPKLIHFIAVTVGVIVVARLLAILILGALGKAFQTELKDGEASNTGQAHLVQRYYPILRTAVTAILVICSAIALLEVWGFNAISWFTRGTVGRNLTSAALTIAVASVVAVAVWEAANAGVERRLARWVERGDVVRAARLRTLLPMLRTCLFIAIVLIVGLTALNEIGINTAPLLAGASIIGVALGFGSQKLVQDFITGIFLLMENAMQVGDWVTVAGVSGSVEYLSIRTVRLRAGDGSLHIVPFSSVTTVNNTNRGIGNASVKVSVGFDSDIDQVIDELKKIGAEIRQDPAFADLTLGDLELWGVDSLDGSMVTIAGQIRCVDKGRWGVQRSFNRRMFERFRSLGIEIFNPHERLLLQGHGNGHKVEPKQSGNEPS